MNLPWRGKKKDIGFNRPESTLWIFIVSIPPVGAWWDREQKWDKILQQCLPLPVVVFWCQCMRAGTPDFHQLSRTCPGWWCLLLETLCACCPQKGRQLQHMIRTPGHCGSKGISPGSGRDEALVWSPGQGACRWRMWLQAQATLQRPGSSPHHSWVRTWPLPHP